MIVKTFLVVLVVIVVTMPDAEAICSYRCGVRCSGWPVRCKWSCRLSCGKKRGVHPSILELPHKMAYFDFNKDGRISKKEFEKALPHPLSVPSAINAFKSLDKNGDGFISCKELGKLARDGKPVC